MSETWTIDSFNPSDGEKRPHGLPADHSAWLRGSGDGARTDYMHLQFSTWAIDAERAKAVVDAVVAGLNSMDQT